MGKYFGTDGFRGEANKDLTVEHAYKVGRYFVWCIWGRMSGKYKARVSRLYAARSRAGSNRPQWE